MNCRILYLVGQLRAGGSERQLYYLLLTLERARYRPAVVVWNSCEDDFYTPYIRALGVPLYSLPSECSAIAKLGRFRSLVKQLKPEVIHSYNFYVNWAAYCGAWGRHIIALGSVRGDFLRDRTRAGACLGRLSASWPRNQIYNSICAVENARRSGSILGSRRTCVIRNGVELDHFPNVDLETRGYSRIVGIGSLLPVKRWDRLVRAASVLKQRRVDCLIQIAGDGPLRKLLMQEAQDLGVADRVEFVGHCDDIPRLLANAAFLVHPSDSEGCPNVVMEAMACGRAVVATNVGDIPYLVEDGKTGFVVPRGDDMRLVECMAKLIAESELCRRMGKAGRGKAEQEFTLDRLVEETLKAYRTAGWADCQPLLT